MGRMRRIVLAIVTCVLPLLTPDVSGAEEQARVYFIEPADGATVASPVHVKMGVIGMAVRKAGQLEKQSGHHHLIINGAPIEKGTVVPADERHIHFGAGQTETDIKLTPGTHSLTLQFADGAHGSYGDSLSSTITIHVK